MTALDGLKQRHGGAFPRFTAGLGRIVGGAIIGSVVTAGLYTGAIEPSKFLTTPAIGQGEIVKANTANTDDLLKKPTTTEASSLDDLFGDLPVKGKVRPKKLDIEPDLFEEEKVFLVDASNMVLADSINDRANDELDAINVIRKAVEQGEGFQDDSIKGEVKADAIIAALDLAKVAKDMDTVAYDNHVFKLSSALPRSVVFTEIVETLNWKRKTVRNAVDVTTQLADAIRSEDTEASMLLMESLTEIMDNYEMATTIEKTAEKLAEGLESPTAEPSPSLDAGALAPSLRNTSGPMDSLRDHLTRQGSVVSRTLGQPSI